MISLKRSEKCSALNRQDHTQNATVTNWGNNMLVVVHRLMWSLGSCVCRELSFWVRTASHGEQELTPQRHLYIATKQTTPEVRGSSMVHLYLLEQLQSVWGNRKSHNSLFKTRFGLATKRLPTLYLHTRCIVSFFFLPKGSQGHT